MGKYSPIWSKCYAHEDLDARIVTHTQDRLRQLEFEGTVLVLSPDTRDRERMVRRGIQGDCSLFLVELIPFHKRGVFPAGLIVTRGGKANHYVRVGIFEYQRPDRFLEPETASEMASRQALFGGLPSRGIWMI